MILSSHDSVILGFRSNLRKLRKLLWIVVRMNTNTEGKLLYKDEVYEIVGIAFDGIVVDAKVIDHITDAERGQMTNYLKITRLRVGVILNFKNPRLEWERIVL